MINKKLALLKLQIAPKRICFLKFILEGYDGLATLSTIDPRQGLVVIRYPCSVKDDVHKLLDELYDTVS